MTNADKIRAMTDEELAVFVAKIETQGYKPTRIKLENVLDWLKQELKQEAE